MNQRAIDGPRLVRGRHERHAGVAQRGVTPQSLHQHLGPEDAEVSTDQHDRRPCGHADAERLGAGDLPGPPQVGEVLVEESVLGWKEYEMEVVRDKKDNCIIICSIENVDPMGVHTGDSITVAPALTLTDKEYQIMRNASIAVLREIGVETGGSNVQFAVNPKDGRLIVIEMNPRVSRSSALASKATGFPIAKVAAKLAVGYTLDELDNDITKVTPASFEPTIDYVVIKIPRFTFEKFPGTPKLLTTSMKSVGEVMAIGRSFNEALQKGLRGMETGLSGLDEVEAPGQPRRQRAIAHHHESEHLERVGGGRQREHERPTHAATSGRSAGMPTRMPTVAQRIGTPTGVKGISTRHVTAPTTAAIAGRRCRSSGHRMATNPHGNAASSPNVFGSIA